MRFEGENGIMLEVLLMCDPLSHPGSADGGKGGPSKNKCTIDHIMFI